MTYLSVADAIGAALKKRWPKRTVYRDLCREDHARPSFFLQIVDVLPEDESCCVVRWTAKLLLTIFEDVNDYSDTPALPLLETQCAVLDLFAASVFAAGDGWVTLTASGAGHDSEAAFVDLTAVWYAARVSDERGDVPMMEHFVYRVGVDAGGG